VYSIDPNWGYNDELTWITITGADFVVTPAGQLQDPLLGSHDLLFESWVDSTKMLAAVPAAMPIGIYDLTISNPDGQTDTLEDAFTIVAGNPIPLEVRPNLGRSDIPNDIYVYGYNFVEGAAVQLGDNDLLNVLIINATQLRATVPAGLPVGVYDLTVINPGGASGTLPQAYTIYDPENDDLYSYDYELWTDPVMPLAAETTQIGLIVHRQGGKTTLNNVVVRFYEGDPATGGLLIGDGFIPFLSPRSQASTTGINWTPATEGDYPIFAVIDPDNTIPEFDEDNNQVNRLVSVFPAGPDTVAPHVDNFSIDDGAFTTTDLEVMLAATASDPAPSSGLASISFLEYEYSLGASYWVPVQLSPWVDYSTAQNGYLWTLLPSVGLKYLQAWAADGAGNVSLYPYGGWINYLPPSDSVAMNQGRIYRYTLTAGQFVTAHVQVFSGDPDLYVWPPDWEQGRPAWVSVNGTGVDDEVNFTAPVSGVYQVEVYGYTAAEYQLTVQITATEAEWEWVPRRTTAQYWTNKVPNTLPLVNLNSRPGNQFALPVPPPSQNLYLYLPIVVR
jgi:hypothetical protein